MSSYNQSESSNSNENEDYIKKRLSPVERGDSAIFGDPISQEKGEIFLHSQEGSYREDEEEVQERSQLDFDQNKEGSLMSRSRENGEKKHSNQQIMEIINGLQPQNKQEIKQQQQKQQIKEQPKEEQKEEAPLQPPHQQSQNQSEINQLSQAKQGQLDNQPIQNEQLQERLKLKQQYYSSLNVNQDQMNLMLQSFKRNSQSIEKALNHILHQNTILAQFKEDASRKLEENIKGTLKEKMNEINRQNSKEIKDIKNLTSTVHELLLSQEKRIEKMERGIDQILSIVKSWR